MLLDLGSFLAFSSHFCPLTAQSKLVEKEVNGNTEPERQYQCLRDLIRRKLLANCAGLIVSSSFLPLR